uniref:(S)-ureidoglycine aminohydrolase cupin domain-containing protein n=1 Tax=Hemiselmis andersenii TaxID=464988 RepID=A0A6T8KKB1_HEMAN|mmetsp:Transcript_7854/g.18122  ORF Transcript_7854/g.18122 Transcript_7854/m.18122 type:complete len:336 (-) Transcript_7854:327-1334(-)
MRIILPVALFLSAIVSSDAFQSPIVPMANRRAVRVATGPCSLRASATATDYLSSLSNVQWQPPTVVPPTPPPTSNAMSGVQPMNGVQQAEGGSVDTFSHAPIENFAIAKLTPKGPRAGADIGQPHDAAKPLPTTVESIKAGSWWCAAGGWPSPNQRPTTEVFYVFKGAGALTDVDGTRHEFGPGDTVILPKGWSGRWDVLQDIHKVWITHDHPNVEVATPIRAVIVPNNALDQQYMSPQGFRTDATHGSPITASRSMFSAGPTAAGSWSCTPGSFPVNNRGTTEFFHVLEGVFFLTNSDGSARRCGPGDTVVLPKGWSGHWDVIETVRKLWVVVD